MILTCPCTIRAAQRDCILSKVWVGPRAVAQATMLYHTIQKPVDIHKSFIEQEIPRGARIMIRWVDTDSTGSYLGAIWPFPSTWPCEELLRIPSLTCDSSKLLMVCFMLSDFGR
jgi:hypothetical protein